jgi:hypothetical protein
MASWSGANWRVTFGGSPGGFALPFELGGMEGNEAEMLIFRVGVKGELANAPWLFQGEFVRIRPRRRARSRWCARG